MTVYFTVQRTEGCKCRSEECQSVEDVCAKLRDEKKMLNARIVHASFLDEDGNQMYIQLRNNKPV